MPNDTNNTAGSDCHERLVRPLSDTPLHARIEDDQLVIRIGIDRLDGHDCHPDFPELPIRDRYEWARDVMRELERDRGDGATPLCLMLDAAMKEALDMGSSAIDYKRPTARDEDGEPCLANKQNYSA